MPSFLADFCGPASTRRPLIQISFDFVLPFLLEQIENEERQGA